MNDPDFAFRQHGFDFYWVQSGDPIELPWHKHQRIRMDRMTRGLRKHLRKSHDRRVR